MNPQFRTGIQVNKNILELKMIEDTSLENTKKGSRNIEIKFSI